MSVVGRFTQLLNGHTPSAAHNIGSIQQQPLAHHWQGCRPNRGRVRRRTRLRMAAGPVTCRAACRARCAPRQSAAFDDALGPAEPRGIRTIGTEGR
jgi:hypothetical protein